MPNDDPDRTTARTPSDLPFSEADTPPVHPLDPTTVLGLGVGSIIAGRYKLLEPLGEGGMGVVWLAEQSEPIRRQVAVKLLQTAMHSKAFLGRFELERQSLALMDHPNIAKILDGGIAPDGRPFFVMERVKGVSITQFCETRNLPLRERLELFLPVCQAIQHAHQKGIIHRDIKPSNVLVALYDDKAVPKVIDFGVAKPTGQPLTEKTLHTMIGSVVGTPAYMSPEQAGLHNLDIDTRSDVYSLGVLLYELLTGTTPIEKNRFRGVPIEDWSRLVREEEPPRPSARLSTTETRAKLTTVIGTESVKLSKLLRGELDWIVMKALEKDRTRRYETASSLARDVERYLADEVVEARPPTVAYRARKFLRKHRGPVIASVMVLLALVGGVVGTVWQAGRAERAQLREQALLSEAEGARLREEASQREATYLRESMLHNKGVAAYIYATHLMLANRDDPDLRPRIERNLQEAADSLEQAYREFPDHLEHAYYLGLTYLSSARLGLLTGKKADIEAALKVLDRAEQLFVGLRNANSHIGLAAVTTGLNEEAITSTLSIIWFSRYTAFLSLGRCSEALVELDRAHPEAVADTPMVPPGGEVILPDNASGIAKVISINQRVLHQKHINKDDSILIRTFLLRGAEMEQSRLPWSRGRGLDHLKAMRLAAYLADTRGVAEAAVYNAACAFALASAAPDIDAAECDRRAALAITYLDRICKAGYFRHPIKGPLHRAELASDKDLDSLWGRADFKRILAEVQHLLEQAPPPRVVSH
jgi:hypothetical protein